MLHISSAQSTLLFKISDIILSHLAVVLHNRPGIHLS